MATYTFVQRGIDDARKIDQSEKNKWSWTWCEKELCDGDDVHLVSDYIRKTTESGIAWCELCKDIIRYGSAGFKAIANHANATGQGKHRAKLRLKKTNYQLACKVIYLFSTAHNIIVYEKLFG